MRPETGEKRVSSRVVGLALLSAVGLAKEDAPRRDQGAEHDQVYCPLRYLGVSGSPYCA